MSDIPTAIPLAEPAHDFVALLDENREEKFERDFSKISADARLDKIDDESLTECVEQIRANMSGVNSVHLEAHEAGKKAYDATWQKFKDSVAGLSLEPKIWEKAEANAKTLAGRAQKDATAKAINDKSAYIHAAQTQLDSHFARIESLLHLAPDPVSLMEMLSTQNPALLEQRMKSQQFCAALDHASLLTMLGVAYSSKNLPLAAACSAALGKHPRSKIKPADVAEQMGFAKLHARIRAAHDEASQLRQIAANTRAGRVPSSLDRIQEGLARGLASK